MNKKYIVRLTGEERAQLDAVVSKGAAKARKIAHAQILLRVDRDGSNWTDERVAEGLGVSTGLVRSVRQRFVEEGLDSALIRKHPAQLSRPPKLDGEKEARLLAIACGAPPEGRVRWTLRLLSGRLVELGIVDGISPDTVRLALKKTSSSLT